MKLEICLLYLRIHLILFNRNECVCEGDKWHIPFGHLFFPWVDAEQLQNAFKPSELEEIKQRRQHEYNNFLKR